MTVFDTESERYDKWFDNNPLVYACEVDAVRNALPHNYHNLRGMEIGVGTGKFSLPFGIKEGVEPAFAMRKKASAKGINALDAKAEKLPYDKNIFDFTLVVTTICFVDSPLKSCKEAYRVLRPGGRIVIGIVDKTTLLGREYEKRRETSLFYKTATFFSTDDIIDLLQKSGFTNISCYQTLFNHPNKLTVPDLVTEGYGEGAFVVICGDK